VASFDDTYREIVTPILKERCRYHGFLVALGDESFSEACIEVMHIANERGATRLSDENYGRLDGWVASLIMKHWNHFEPQVEAQAAQHQRAIRECYEWAAQWTKMTTIPR
jgi:hypothetical protein